MIADITLRLAQRGDAPSISNLSRDLIERGLGWSWTPRRVMRSIADADTNALVALDAAGALQGFGIMKYAEEEAHLLLLAVQTAQSRRGIGSALLAWLEASALIAGVRDIWLEARASNVAARQFYRQRGYREVELLPGYYQGREDSVRLLKNLWQTTTGKGLSRRAGDGLR